MIKRVRRVTSESRVDTQPHNLQTIYRDTEGSKNLSKPQRFKYLVDFPATTCYKRQPLSKVNWFRESINKENYGMMRNVASRTTTVSTVKEGQKENSIERRPIRSIRSSSLQCSSVKVRPNHDRHFQDNSTIYLHQFINKRVNSILSEERVDTQENVYANNHRRKHSANY